MHNILNTDIKRPVLRYHGGKFILAKWIVSHFPEHKIYVEPFGGAGSVLMRKERSYAEVYNDTWDTVVNVFSILRDPEAAKELERRLRLTPFSRVEFKLTETPLNEIQDPIERARLTIFRSFAGFASASANTNHSTGFRANAHQNGTTPAQDWKSYANSIPAFVERLTGVVIENKDYKSVIDQHDTPETLIYLYPPYVLNSRRIQGNNNAYQFEMDNEQHYFMCNYILTKKSKFIVSGYENDLYNSILKDWKKVERKAYADGGSLRTEILWLSPNCFN